MTMLEIACLIYYYAITGFFTCFRLEKNLETNSNPKKGLIISNKNKRL